MEVTWNLCVRVVEQERNAREAISYDNTCYLAKGGAKVSVQKALKEAEEDINGMIKAALSKVERE